MVENSADQAIRLGLMPPLTGIVGIYGKEICRAAQVACSEVNESGGVLGKKLMLVIEDDGSLPESAIVAATKLIDERQCSALIGNLLSNARMAVAYRVAEARGIPLLNFSFYEGSILSPCFFHFAALPNQQIDQMIPYMHAEFGGRMFFAGNNYEWPRGSIDAAKRALSLCGGQVVGEEYFPIGTDDAAMERLLDHVAIAAPDVFVPYFAGDDQAKLLTRFAERGFKDRMAVVMGHFDEMLASTLPPQVRQGLYSSNSYFMTVKNPENERYLAKLAKLPGVTGIWPAGDGITTNFGEGAYICVKAFALAANAAGSVEAEPLIAALKKTRLAAPQGLVQMHSEHQHARVNAYLTRCGHDGSFEIIRSFGAIDPQLPQRYRHQDIHAPSVLKDDLRFQARMLEQMSDGVFVVPAATKEISYANQSVETIFGFAPGEMSGLSVLRLSGAENDTGINLADIFTIVERAGRWQGDVSLLAKDDKSIWCSVTISAFTHPVLGEVWLCILRDISDRKEIEARMEATQAHLTATIAAIPDLMLEIDIEGRYYNIHAQREELLPLPIEQMVGKTVREVLPPEPAAVVYRALAEAHATGTSHGLQITRPLPWGDAWFELSVSRKKVAEGQMPRFILLSRDITERKKNEAKVRQMNERLEELVKIRTAQLETTNKELEAFSYSVSHDLRSPLRSIDGWSLALLEDYADELDATAQKYLGRIRADVARMGQLIDSLLRLSQISRTGMASREVNLSALAERVISRLREGEAPPGTGFSIVPGLNAVCDEKLIEIALSNLLGNAVKFSAKTQQPKIEFGSEDNNGRRIFFIRDNGVGFDMAYAGRLFGAFQRMHKETEYPGNGIGLATVQKIIHAHRGEIWADSAVGLGTTFYFTLGEN